MKALDDYNTARNALNKTFDTCIYEGIMDHRDSYYWIEDRTINWVDEKPTKTFSQLLNDGPMYSESITSLHESKCGLYIGMKVHDCCGNTDFYIFDRSKCLGTVM